MSAFSPVTRYGFPYGPEHRNGFPYGPEYRNGFPYGPEHRNGSVNTLVPRFEILPANTCCFHEIYRYPQGFHDMTGWPSRPPLCSSRPPAAQVARKKPDEPVKTMHKKPTLSYVELIAEAILNSQDKCLVLGDIYDAILDRHPFFESRGSGWRNSIRHNLSLSDCFIKGERSPNGKGHLWKVDQQCFDETMTGKMKHYKKRKAKKTSSTSSDYEEVTLKKPAKIVHSVNLCERKLSLSDELKFDDEIKRFEIARQKLTEVKYRSLSVTVD